MFCKSCGTKNPDSGKFCRSCGAPLTPAKDFSKMQVEQPQMNKGYETFKESEPKAAFAFDMVGKPEAAPYYTEGEVEESPLTKGIRKVAKSPLFIITTILYTLNIVLHVFSVMVGSAAAATHIDALLDQYAHMFDYPEASAYIDEALRYVDTMAESSVVAAIAGQIVPILIAIGLWMMVFSGMKKKMSTGGLTLIRVIYIIGLVFVCLGAAIVLGACAVLFFAGDLDQDMKIGAGVAMGFIALVELLVILFYAKICKTLLSAKRAIRGEDYKLVFSGYVSFWLWIGAILTIITAIGIVVVSVAALGQVIDFYGPGSMVLAAVQNIMFASLIKRARVAVREM